MTIEDAAKKPKYEINIEGTDYLWNDDQITVPQLRELGHLPASEPVLEVDLNTNQETTLSEDAVVDVKPGQGFGRKVEFKRGRS
jgi:hypothetical protein